MPVEASFPDYTVTGPIHWFARTPTLNRYATPGSAKIWYLGTCTTKPQTRETKFYLDVFNDLGGRKVPSQQIHAGTLVTVGLAMNRISELAVNAIKNAGGQDGNAAGTGEGVGFEGPNTRGSLVFGRSSVELWALYSFFDTVADPADRIPKGRYYPVAVIGYEDLSKQGNEDSEKILAFQCHGQYGGATGNKARGWSVYSEAAADFPGDVALANIQ